MLTNSKSSRKAGQDKKKKLTEKSMSFHGHATEEMEGKVLWRPRTQPDLISGTGRVPSSTEIVRPKLTKLLLNVTVQRSLGSVHVLISLESTVADLIAATLQQYSKESRRPIFPSINPSGFGLHYSQFSLESLDPDEKLIELGSRNFFLCPKSSVAAGGSGGDDGEIGFDYAVTTASSSCSTEATKSGGGWRRFMNFSL